MRRRRLLGLLLTLALLLVGGGAFADPPDVVPADVPDAAPPPSARARGLAWLAAHQNEDGSWGRIHVTATTALGCLAYLSAARDPFAGPGAAPLVKALTFLVGHHRVGAFPKDGHTWIHGQGFATLALAEAWGRTLLGATKPDLDLERLRKSVPLAVRKIQQAQSHSGGWWYDRSNPHDHEGSTTVCAVQALVSASNFGVEIDQQVLAKGFEYLKRCQNPDGGFDYKEGPGTTSMKEGTAGDVATLALMRRFDYMVMTKGVDFLEAVGPAAISAERFPYYGHFYASMGLLLFGEEMGAEQRAATWVEAAVKDVRSWQVADGSWPLKGWMTGSGAAGDDPYATAFAVLLLGVPDKHLSIFHRRPPAPPVVD